MVKRRAISKEDQVLAPNKLPLLYQTLAPLVRERHSGLFLSKDKSYDFARTANAIPLTVEEFPMALQHYPIVFSDGDAPMPLALVGFKPQVNEYVVADGGWKPGAYVPAYLRRYPFAFVRESENADRNVLCADLSSVMFVSDGPPERALFTDEETSALLTSVLDFCRRYDAAMARTRAAVQEFSAHDLIGPATVSISKKGENQKVQGFQSLSEEKLRTLPDDVLAGFMRRGLSTVISAHLMSLANFASVGTTE